MDPALATIVVGVLSLVGTLIGSIAGIMTAQKLTVYRIEQLEKKVDKMYENTTDCNNRLTVLEKDNRVQWKAIEEIKTIIKEIHKEVESRYE